MARPSLFPPYGITEARKIADTIAQKASGQPMRRLDIFKELGKAPGSSRSRQLVTASSSYGLTTGSYIATKLSLAPIGGRLAVDGDETALIDAVFNVEIFKKFFVRYEESGIPSNLVGKSFLAEEGIPTDRTKACWDSILANGRAASLISDVGGTEMVLSRDHAKENITKKAKVAPVTPAEAGEEPQPTPRPDPTPAEKPRPDVHIDIQIHIDASASAEQIDKIFSSMERYIYPKSKG